MRSSKLILQVQFKFFTSLNLSHAKLQLQCSQRTMTLPTKGCHQRWPTSRWRSMMTPENIRQQQVRNFLRGPVNEGTNEGQCGDKLFTSKLFNVTKNIRSFAQTICPDIWPGWIKWCMLFNYARRPPHVMFLIQFRNPLVWFTSPGTVSIFFFLKC